MHAYHSAGSVGYVDGHPGHRLCLDDTYWEMGEEKNTKIIQAKETQTTGKEHIQSWAGGIHPLHLHS